MLSDFSQFSLCLSITLYFEAEIQRSLSINFDIDSEYEQYLIMDDLKLYIANEYFSELETLVAWWWLISQSKQKN